MKAYGRERRSEGSAASCMRACIAFGWLGLYLRTGLQEGVCAVGSRSWLPMEVITFCP